MNSISILKEIDKYIVKDLIIVNPGNLCYKDTTKKWNTEE